MRRYPFFLSLLVTTLAGASYWQDAPSLVLNPYTPFSTEVSLWPKSSCADSPSPGDNAIFLNFMEGTGTTLVNDSTTSEYTNSITRVGGTSWSDERVYFNGNNGAYIKVPGNSYFDFTSGGYVTFGLVVSGNGLWGVDGGSAGTSSRGSAYLMGYGNAYGSDLQIVVGTATINLRDRTRSAFNVTGSISGVWDGDPHLLLIQLPWSGGGAVKVWYDSPTNLVINTTASTYRQDTESEHYIGDNPNDTWWEEFKGYIYHFRANDKAFSTAEREAFFEDPYAC